jgi:hypothetical protein
VCRIVPVDCQDIVIVVVVVTASRDRAQRGCNEEYYSSILLIGD